MKFFTLMKRFLFLSFILLLCAVTFGIAQEQAPPITKEQLRQREQDAFNKEAHQTKALLNKNQRSSSTATFSVNPVNPTTNPLESIIQSLVGKGVEISDIQSNLPETSPAFGSFDNGMEVLGIKNGLLITSGKVINTIGPNASEGTSSNNETLGYDKLNTIAPNGKDACVISFSIKPQSSFLSFKYVFGSEEYNEYVGSGFNDVFAFFISGPGIDGEKNIALLPGTNTPVAVNNVNKGYLNRDAKNSDFYINNTSGSAPKIIQAPDPARQMAFEYDGLTVPLTAVTEVIPGETYTLTLAIQDVGDGFFDSGVFLEGGSISSSPLVDLGPDIHACEGETVTLDAGEGLASYLWSDNSTEQTLQVTTSGTYIVTVKNSGGTSDSDTIKVTFHTLPVVDLGTDKTITAGESVVLDAGSGFTSYLWSDNSTGQTLTVNSSGTYSVKVKNEYGCEGSDEIKITVIDGVPPVNGGMVATADGSFMVYTCPGDGKDDWVTVKNSSESTASYAYVVTDDKGAVLALPSGNSINFEEASAGICRIYGISYTGMLTVKAGDKIEELSSYSDETSDLSDNYIIVYRDMPDGALVKTEDGKTEINTCPGDGVDDKVTMVNTSSASSNYTYIVTDNGGTILILAGSNTLNFEGTSEGIFRVYGVSYSGKLTAEVGVKIQEATISDNCWDLSKNWITVNRSKENCEGSLLSVIPIKECVTKNADGTYTCSFGYMNPNDKPVTIEIGANNKFSVMQNAGQPVTFTPGRQVGAFYVVFDGSPLTWTLGNQTVTVEKSEKPCPIPIQPVEPIFDCITDLGNYTYMASCGYNNPNNRPIAIALGDQNKFNIGRNLGQPTIFEASKRAVGEFYVVFNGNTLSWKLGGNTVVTNRFDKQCPIPTQPVEPVLECVTFNAPGDYTAHYGYKNPNNRSIGTVYGGFNRFRSGVANMGQPRIFKTGTHEKVFSVNFDGTDLQWDLMRSSVVASNNPELNCDGILPVQPIFECVTNNGDGTYTASCGYYNPNSFPVTIELGNYNNFNIGENVGQTVEFASGRRVGVFYVVFDGGNLTWNLGGLSDQTSSKEKPCPIPLQEVKPVVECVMNNGDGTYTAHFGYNNPNNRNVGIVVGTKNKFNMEDNMNQPVIYKVGRHENVFAVTFDGTDLVWTLCNSTAMATDKPEQNCSAAATTKANTAANAKHAQEDRMLTGKEFNFYPNPTENKLILQYTAETKTRINVLVYSVSGQVMLKQALNMEGASTHELDVSKLTPGIYILKTYNGSKTEHFRIVKQ